MRKLARFAALVVLVILVPLSAYANGTADKAQTADGKENWKSEIDLSGKKAGKYNILITGADRAGNISYSGPINVIVDPKSDLPVVSISNPLPGMRVGGDLNVVGNCVDDDGVATVEIQIDGGEFVKAQGTEFWSYYLDGATLPDGRHTVVVRGVDVNGKAGLQKSVYFDLDRNRPVSMVDSHATGTLVSGKVTLEGVSLDANGVSELGYSLDEGKTFIKLDLKSTKAQEGKAFQFSLDSAKRPDGPFIIWFKSKDRAGSVGVSPFLLFIDNTKPTVELISPAKDQKVNGEFDAVCRVYDLIGIAELSWTYGGDQKGAIEVKPGNPYFTAALKVPQKGEAPLFSVKAKDVSGNVVVLNSKILVDDKADLPVAAISYPASGAQLSGPFSLSGFARDDDGIQAVKYRIDATAPVELKTTGAYIALIGGMGVGKHQINVWAVDLNGREGLPVKVDVVQGGAEPSIELVSLSAPGPDKKPVQTPFRSGIEAAPDSGAQVSGIVRSDGKVTSLSYQLGNGKAEKISPAKAQGEIPFSFPLPSAGPYGLLDIQVSMTDEFGRAASVKSFVYVTDYSMIRREPDFDFADERLAADGRVSLGMDKPFALSFVGEEIESAELIPAGNVVSLERSGSVLYVKAAKEGTSASTAIRVKTVKKHTFTSRQFVFATGDKGPEISFSSPEQGASFSKSFSVKGTAQDAAGVASLSWSLWPAGDKKPINAKAGAFEFVPEFAAIPEGPSILAVEAVDSGGNASRAYLAVVKDSAGPTIVSLSPVEATDAELAVAGLASDPSGIASVEFAADGKSFSSISSERYFTHSYNPVQSPNAKYRLTDKAGNQVVADPPHFLNPAPMPSPAKGPAVAILSPQANANASGEVFLSVKVVSSGTVSSVSWSCDALKGSFDPQTGPVYHARIPLAGIKAKNATIVVQAVDDSKASGKAQVTILLSAQTGVPVVELLSPVDGAAAEESPLLAFKASADSGVDSVSYSLDGAVFTELSGKRAFASVLGGLAPGMHTVSVKAKGSGGVESAALKRSFKVPGGKASFKLAFASGKDVKEYLPGMALVTKDMKLTGSVTAANGISGLVAKLPGGAETKPALKKVSATESSFEIALPANLAYDKNEIILTVQDASGSVNTEYVYFYRVTPAAESRQSEGIYVLDSRTISGEGPYDLRLSGSSLQARFVGRPIASVSILPDSGGIATASFEGRLISLSPGKDGVSKSSKLVVKTVDGDSFEWGPFVAMVDSGPPSVEIESPVDDQWVKDSVIVSLSASDPNGLSALAWSLDGASWTPLAASADGKMKFSLPLSSAADGAITLSLRAQDRAGKTTIVTRCFNKDTQLPAGAVIAPRPIDTVNGYITVAAGFADAGGSLDKLEFSTDGKTWEALERPFAGARDVELAKVDNNPANIKFKSTDKAGNSLIASPTGTVDGKTDLPVVKIQLPQEMEVQRADFEISGVVTDDDGVKAIYYKLDRNEVVKLELTGQSSFAIPIRLQDTTDNQHVVEVTAEDVFGVKGETIVRTYRVSKEEPVATMANPPIEKTVKGVVTLEGTTSDANGITRVSLSVDNSLSYNLCDGDVNWKYRLDTRALEDGLHSLYIKPVDKYDTEGFFATLINIDNTPPKIVLDQPADGSEVSGVLQTSGRVSDSVSIKSVSLEFNRIGTQGGDTAAGGGKTNMVMDLGLEQIITRGIDISELQEGVYNLIIRVLDRADNQALATRTVTVVRKKKTDSISLMFPLKGEAIAGEFSIHGLVKTEKPVATAAILIDDAEIANVPIDENGFFSSAVLPAELADGTHVLGARIVTASGDTLVTAPVPVSYKRSGPWIAIDTFKYGNYLPNRPYMKGRAGWFDENLESLDKNARAKAQKDREVKSVAISFDNGKSFLPAKGASRWQYRLETQEYREGALYIVMKATFADGTLSYAKTVFNLDKTPPKVTLLAPIENERLNEKIDLIGTASDETRLSDVKVLLRPGDKVSYAVPSFIQGLYFDVHAMGATLFEVGAGLTFFDENVKLMGFYGQGLPEADERFSGNVFGAKLLANIYYLPFSYMLGPDWEWLSANLALGAGFSYFTQTGSGSPLTLASFLAQVEFPIITIPRLKVLRKYSFYTEFQVWLISSDVQGGIMPRVSFGGRASVF
jgi:hypothetical protein